MTMSPEEHTAAIRSLQSDVADIKGILNNGLRDDGSGPEDRADDGQGRHPADPRRAHRSRRQGGRRSTKYFKRVMNTGVTITGALIALLLSIIGYLLVNPVGLH